jgi:hypothetical protein
VVVVCSTENLRRNLETTKGLPVDLILQFVIFVAAVYLLAGVMYSLMWLTLQWTDPTTARIFSLQPVPETADELCSLERLLLQAKFVIGLIALFALRTVLWSHYVWRFLRSARQADAAARK